MERSITEVEAERARCCLAIEGDAAQLVALGDAIEELGEELIEGLALANRRLEALRVEEVGLFERGHRGHELIEARVVADAEERVTHRAEVGEELADEGEARDRRPAIRAGIGVARFAGEGAG